MHHKWAVVTPVQQEGIANPQKVVFGLLVQRNTGPQPRMHEQLRAHIDHAWTGRDKIQIGLGHKGGRFCARHVHVMQRGHAVALQRGAPTNRRVQIV